jgi:hypothetical protein
MSQSDGANERAEHAQPYYGLSEIGFGYHDFTPARFIGEPLYDGS